MKKQLLKTKLLLIGGSLTHICLINKLSKWELERLKIILITPFPFYYYLEMAAGYLEGVFTEEKVAIDLAKVCQRKGVHFIAAQSIRIDAKGRAVTLDDGRRIEFDILSLNLEPFGCYLEGLSQYGIPVRYNDNLPKIKHRFQERNMDSNITIVGAGKLGIEVALALRGLVSKNHRNMDITLIEGSQSLLPGYDITVKRMIQEKLKQQQIELLLGRSVIRVTGDLLVFNDNSVLEYGYLIWTVKPNRYPILEACGLVRDEQGRIIVNPDLKIQGYDMIFACGENVVIQDHDSFDSQLDPEKEADLLLKNIMNTVKAVPSLKITPSKITKRIIYLGHQRAITQKHESVSKGRMGWHIRKSHDQKLIKKLQNG
jgi:NADH dehydrogenase FAD-containing subunit